MMRNNRPVRKGTLIVLAIGLMTVVSVIITSQLENVRMGFPIARNMRYQIYADSAARSGIEYGYALVKNVMESLTMMGPRFATHYSGNEALGGGPVAEVPPYWLQVIDPGYDLKARNAFLADNKNGLWVGTDSFLAPYGEDDTHGIISMDHGYVMRNPDYLHSSFGSHRDMLFPGDTDLDEDIGFTIYGGQPMESDNRECHVEIISGGIDPLYVLLFDKSSVIDIKHCDKWREQDGAGLSEWPDRYEQFGEPPETLLYGHFGDRRWHYYDGFEFNLKEKSPPSFVVDSDFGSPAPITGTGGTIVVKMDNTGSYGAVSGLKPHDDTDEPWADTFSNFFERLFYYDYWEDDHSDTLTKPPYHEPADDSESAYHVRLFTHLHLDDPVHVSDDATLTAANSALFDPNEYGSIDFISFFKLWIVRDKRRSNFTSGPGGRITTTFVGGHDLLDWKGNPISMSPNDEHGVPIETDLHPIWTLPRNTGSIYGYAWNSSTSEWVDNSDLGSVTNTSYWRRNFLSDWHNGNEGNSQFQMGVLAWPVPFLAYQRGDHDYFSNEKRGDESEFVAPLYHEHYTKFILYSLGTVRMPDETLLTQNRLREDQAISDFRVVSRSLYRMVFYMELRAPDVVNDDQVASPRIEEPFRVEEVGECEAVTQQNQMNWAFFNSRFIPICDIQPSVSSVRNRFFEPRGIYMRSIEKVPYSDSEKI